MYPHRTYCDTLAECREVLKHIDKHNLKISKSTLSALIEECQMYGNRMEAALSYTHDLNRLHKKKKKVKAEVTLLENLLKAAEEECKDEGIEVPEKDKPSRSWTARQIDLLDDED